jgi:ribosomal protein L25 (general stress protein Ctc)
MQTNDGSKKKIGRAGEIQKLHVVFGVNKEQQNITCKEVVVSHY